MNDFDLKQQELENLKCPKCKGLGELDDAHECDIYYNTWACTDCKGTGIKEEGVVR